MTSLRSLPLGRRLGIVGALLASAVAIAAGPSTAGAATRSTGRCGVAGLDFSYASAGATYGVKVVGLRAGGVKCSAARSLVDQVAMDLLHGRHVPKRIAGLAVAVHQPCAGCAPQYTGTATATHKRVTFVIAGGA
ncbi:MAG TPA: hypothetical protein VIJ51_12670 [Solirubrobacteraceae bacterium]